MEAASAAAARVGSGVPDLRQSWASLSAVARASLRASSTSGSFVEAASPTQWAARFMCAEYQTGPSAGVRHTI